MSKKRKTLVVDIDGTLCPLKEAAISYSELQPFEVMLMALRAWREDNGYIVLYTARNMRTYEGNIGLINANTAPVLIEWLTKWDIPYDELILGKPWPGEEGFYVDDRAVRPREFLEFTKDQLEKLVENDRLRHV